MGILNHQNFSTLLNEELRKITIPKLRERRIGATESVNDVMQYVERDINATNQLINDGEITEEKGTQYLTDLGLEIMSFLYAVGAEHTVWRRWSSLAGFGMFLQGDIFEAAQYAILGGEWNFLTVLPNLTVESRQTSEQVIWSLIKGESVDVLVEETRDAEDEAWLQLANSIPAQDHQKTETALQTITDFWIAENDDDWENFHIRSYPDFETSVCVVAALARRNGFQATNLKTEQYRFLEPGLAIPEPISLFPNTFSLAES